MGALTDARAALRAVLDGQVLADGVALEVFDAMPEAWHPPILIIEPSDPWWSMNANLPSGMAQVRYDVAVIAARGTNPALIPKVEALIEQVLTAILSGGHGWTPESVPAPEILATAQDSYLASRVTVTIPARIVA